MNLGLRRKLRIETDEVAGRMVTRLFIGDEELPATPELRRAVAQLAAGAPVVDAKLLYEAGVLERVDDPVMPEGLALRLGSRVALDLTLRAAQVRLPHREGPRVRTVLPEASLPLDLFVPPFKLRPTLDLAHAIRAAWFRLVAQAHGRGESVDRAEAARLLGALATERVRQSPEVQPVWDIESDRLVPVGPLQDGLWHYPIARLELHADRIAAESGHAPASRIALNPHAPPAEAEQELRRIGALLGTLQRSAGEAEVAPVLEDAPHSARQLYREVIQARLLVKVQDRLTLDDGMEPGSVRHLGHATLLANLGGAYVLIDPWFVPGSERDLEQPPAVCNLPELAAVFFTHHHWDHVHLQSLLKLDKATPVYVPDQPEGPVMPRTARVLQALGFTSVNVIPHGAIVEVGAGGAVEAAPFLGEDPTRLGFGANTYVLVNGGKAAWVHVDAGPDARGRSSVTEGVAADLKARYGAVSPIYATRRQERGTMVEYDWTFLLRPFSEWVEPAENCATGAAFLAELCEAAGASTLVLYSEGGASWYPQATDFLRRGEPAAMDAIYEDGWDTLAEIAGAVEAVGAGIVLSSPRDLSTIGS